MPMVWMDKLSVNKDDTKYSISHINGRECHPQGEVSVKPLSATVRHHYLHTEEMCRRDCKSIVAQYGVCNAEQTRV